MSEFHGKFAWYELMTADMAAAEKFYCDVVGWTAKDAGMPEMSYTILSASGRDTSGLMTIPPDAAAAGARPAWIGYVAVDDVDASAAAFTEGGGAVHYAPHDIPGVGRIAVVTDPQGAMLALITPTPQSQPPPAPANMPGHTGWHELYAGELDTAFPFYAQQFGWTKADAMDMGPMGTYQLFAYKGETVGGMMTKPAQIPAPMWLYYFNVDGIDAAEARVKAGGGQILMGPHEVPGGSWILQCLDPQGAMFALTSPHR